MALRTRFVIILPRLIFPPTNLPFQYEFEYDVNQVTKLIVRFDLDQYTLFKKNKRFFILFFYCFYIKQNKMKLRSY